MGVRKPVSTTSSMLMPSTPTAYSMPKAGIHDARSTNWKSAEAGSKRAQSSSVSPNTASDTTSATCRARPARCSSRLPTRRMRIAPATGSAMSDVRIGKVIRPAAPRSRRTARGNSRGRPRRQRSATRRRRAPSRSAAGGAVSSRHSRTCPAPLTAPSMTPASTTSPEHAVGRALDRLHDGRVVELVHVVLVQEQPVERRRARRHCVGRRRAAARRRTRRGRCR